jgi:DNA replication protein DnaC
MPLYIYGPIGSGKSHLAWALMRRYIESFERVKPYAVSTAELLHRLRPGGERWTTPQGNAWEGRSQPQRINDLEDAKNADLLLLDDLGAEHLTDFAGERLMVIIDHRYNHQLPTIYTSNLAPADLKAKVGERITSRIAHNATLVPIIGEDRRRILTHAAATHGV